MSRQEGKGWPQSYAQPRRAQVRESLGMGEIKQPSRGRAGDAVPPSATTVKTLNIVHAVQEAKNTRHATDPICNNNMSPARRVAIRDYLRDIASSVRVVQSVHTTPNETCSRAPTAQSLLVRRAGLTCCKGLWWSVSLQDPHPAWEYESGCSNNQHAMYCMAPVDPLEQWLER